MNRAVFLDRDGVVNEIIYEPDGNLMAPATIAQIKIIKNVKEGIALLKTLGFKIIVVTNQPGVAFGYLREEKLKEVNEFLKKELGIDEIYSCIHNPKTEECICRKPKTGLIDKAKKEFNLDIKNSYMVGDNLSDIQTGINFGARKTFRIGILREDIIELQHQKKIYPNYTLPDLVQVANKIKELEPK